jgi:hypothetical protein
MIFSEGQAFTRSYDLAPHPILLTCQLGAPVSVKKKICLQAKWSEIRFVSQVFSLVHLKNSVIFFRFFLLLFLLLFCIASTNYFSSRRNEGKPFLLLQKKQKPFTFASNIFSFASKNTCFALFRFTFLCISFISPEGSAKLRWGGGGQEREHNVFRVPRSSLRVWSSSVGCSVAQKGAA